MIPDWQLPLGVDRGLHDYFRSAEMVHGYDAQMHASPLAAQDLAFCRRHFPVPGPLVDLGCGTGRLCHAFAAAGYACTGIDLSEEMLAKARETPSDVRWLKANIVELSEIAAGTYCYAACLFSTLGMIRGTAPRRAFLANVHRLLAADGVFVLHVHNRKHPALGLRRHWQDEFPMPQAYAGAPLTIKHYTRSEITQDLHAARFRIAAVELVELPGETRTPHGFLLAAAKA
jgi:SAM-dependent methyltransferase